MGQWSRVQSLQVPADRVHQVLQHPPDLRVVELIMPVVRPLSEAGDGGPQLGLDPGQDDPQPRGLSPGRQRDLQQNTKDNIQA